MPGRGEGFAAHPAEIRNAGATVSRVVGQIRSADVRAPLEELGGLLPGSSAADAARGCALASSRGLAGWCDHAQTHAANLIGSGAGYSDTEHGATNIFPLGEY